MDEQVCIREMVPRTLKKQKLPQKACLTLKNFPGHCDQK